MYSRALHMYALYVSVYAAVHAYPSLYVAVYATVHVYALLFVLYVSLPTASICQEISTTLRGQDFLYMAQQYSFNIVRVVIRVRDSVALERNCRQF